MAMNLKAGDMDKVARTIHVGGVGGLGDEIKEQDLAEFFAQYGVVYRLDFPLIQPQKVEDPLNVCRNRSAVMVDICFLSWFIVHSAETLTHELREEH
eukprot:5638483-Pyramimonas_sp.AAC.1